MRHRIRTYIFVVVQFFRLVPCRYLRDGVVVVWPPILGFVHAPRRGRVSVHCVEPLTRNAVGDDFVARRVQLSMQKFPEPRRAQTTYVGETIAPTLAKALTAREAYFTFPLSWKSEGDNGFQSGSTDNPE
jgi:hypothetical protein